MLHGFSLTIANVTHLFNNVSLVLKHEFDAMLVSEHSSVSAQFVNLRQKLGKQHKFHLSSLDGEVVHHTGGTGGY